MLAHAMLVPRRLVNDDGLLLLLLDDSLTLHCEEKVVEGTRTERMFSFVAFLRGGWLYLMRCRHAAHDSSQRLLNTAFFGIY